MAAFRFLALLTVGFSLLVLIFLLHVHQARLEREMTREIEGPSLVLKPGSSVSWIVDFGGARVEEAWPGAQRQPRMYLRGVQGAAAQGPQGVEVDVTARYVARPTEPDEPGQVALSQAFIAGPVGGGAVRAVAGPANDEVSAGELWLSWNHPLEITATVVEAPPGGGEATLVLHGGPTRDYVAARSISRTLWAVFSIMSAAGFAGLVLTVRASARREATGSRQATAQSSGNSPAVRQ